MKDAIFRGSAAAPDGMSLQVSSSCLRGRDDSDQPSAARPVGRGRIDVGGDAGASESPEGGWNVSSCEAAGSISLGLIYPRGARTQFAIGRRIWGLYGI